MERKVIASSLSEVKAGSVVGLRGLGRKIAGFGRVGRDGLMDYFVVKVHSRKSTHYHVRHLYDLEHDVPFERVERLMGDDLEIYEGLFVEYVAVRYCESYRQQADANMVCQRRLQELEHELQAQVLRVSELEEELRAERNEVKLTAGLCDQLEECLRVKDAELERLRNERVPSYARIAVDGDGVHVGRGMRLFNRIHNMFNN